MGKRNGYFQLCMKEDGTYIRLFPPVGGGESISLEELIEYLTSKKYTVDTLALHQKMMDLTRPAEVRISDTPGVAEGEMFSLKLSADKMRAVARFYPASEESRAMSRTDILSDLQYKGIKAGIDMEVVDSYLSDRHYCTDYVIAKGTETRQGSDAKIEYLFDTNPDTKPTMNSDGTVDFFHLNIISKCSKGQVLATLTKEDRGEAGQTVTGERVTPKDVRRLMLKYGRNITLSEDGLSISSNVNGHVSLVDDKVFVTDVYEVTDVDTSTGNIDYNGNVVVQGNVKAGFRVAAEGNIEVRGVVEGALLDARRDIIITRGVNGMGKGQLSAGGNVVAKFIENATVYAGGYVRAEAIMHSYVSANSDVEVTGRKGFITGGVIRSLGTVSARVIGSAMGADTEIEVGIVPGIKMRLNTLQQSITAARKSISQIEPVLLTLTKRIQKGEKLTPEQVAYFKKLSSEYKLLRPQLEKDVAEYKSLNTSIDTTSSSAIVKVSGFAYAGTKITISDASLYITDTQEHCRFVKDDGEIKMRPL